MWRLLIQGLPSQGVYKSIYDRQRRSTEEYRERAAKQRRKRYKKNPEPSLTANRNYKDRFVAEHGLEAWNARQREYKRNWLAKPASPKDEE